MMHGLNGLSVFGIFFDLNLFNCGNATV